MGMSPLNLRAGDTGSVFASLYGSGNAGTYVNGNVRIRTLKPLASTSETGPLFTQLSTSYNQIAVDQSWKANSAQIVTTGLAVGQMHRVGEVIFNPGYDDTVRTIVFPVNGRIFSSAPRLQGAGMSGNTFTLSTNEQNGTATASFDLQNADVLLSIGTTWRQAIRNSPQLIRLAILDYELIYPAGVFSVSGLGGAGSGVGGGSSFSPIVLDGDQLRSIGIGFDPTGIGDITATLRLLTDINAPVGQAGDYFTITLSAIGVPEPTSLLVLGGATAVLLRRTRRREMCRR
jgi:hypothetical protein